MGCLSATVKSLHEPLIAKVSLQNEPPIAKVSLQNEPLIAKVSLQNEPPIVKVSLQNEPLMVTCSLICSIAPMIVLPENVQWVDTDSTIAYKIITNRYWTIS